MVDVSDNFVEKLENGEIQHIFGQIIPKNSNSDNIFLDNSTLVGDVVYSRQCTANEDEFGIGQLYTGTAQISVESAEIDRLNLRGGKFYLELKVGNSIDNERLRLGEWTITEPRRTSRNIISITGVDCIGLLDVPIPVEEVGAITLENRMKLITKLTGVEFSQTAEEIQELTGYNGMLFGTEFCATCREEVAAIAAFMGGIACDDRHGKIKFRRFSTAPVLEIPVELRHDINLSEYTVGIRGVAYHDKYGYTFVRAIDGENVNSAIIPVLSGNPYIWDIRGENADNQYNWSLGFAADNLNIPDWTPGEIEYYGNPALEIGDMVRITGCINQPDTNFLITAEHWQFRGGHTLISAGVANGGISTNYGSSATASQIITANLNVTKNITAIDFENSIVRFSTREQSEVFADISAILNSDNQLVQIKIFLDGEQLKPYFAGIARTDEPLTAHLTAHMNVGSGVHTLYTEISENAGISLFVGYIWGQGIVSELAIFPDISELEKYSVEMLGQFRITKLEGK